MGRVGDTHGLRHRPARPPRWDDDRATRLEQAGGQEVHSGPFGGRGKELAPRIRLILPLPHHLIGTALNARRLHPAGASQFFLSTRIDQPAESSTDCPVSRSSQAIPTRAVRSLSAQFRGRPSILAKATVPLPPSWNGTESSASDHLLQPQPNTWKSP